ncbi:MAG: GHKL domain-containing protein [Clostridiales bacterium]|nr:GHKL domain-containing protein [Clostridiales bacterium]
MNKLQKPKFAYYILVMPLSSAFAIYLLFLLTYDVKGGIVLVVELAVTLLVLSNIATLYIIDRLLEYEGNKEKLQFMQKQFHVQEGHYKELEQRQYEINEFYHNIKNYLLAVEGYINNGEYEKAKDRIKQANDTINYESQNTIKTGNIGLDALINAKIIRMQKSNIEFDYNIKIPNVLSIDYIDLCIIIGNALDNAIEACININEGARRISLTCIQTGNYISIVIINTVAENIPNLEGNDYITTKANKNLHGFGLRSIKHIAEKNKGNVIIEQENNQFKIKIILYNELI